MVERSKRELERRASASSEGPSIINVSKFLDVLSDTPVLGVVNLDKGGVIESPKPLPRARDPYGPLCFEGEG